MNEFLLQAFYTAYENKKQNSANLSVDATMMNYRE